MDICRACGQSGFASQNDDDCTSRLVDIYYKLTAIQVAEAVGPSRMVFCNGCTGDLNHFDEFRMKCLEVYQRLQHVKVEAWKEDTFMLVEVKMERDEEPEVEQHFSKDDESTEDIKQNSEHNIATKEDDTDGEDEEDEDEFNIGDNDDDNDEDSEIEIGSPKLETDKNPVDRKTRIRNRDASNKKIYLNCPKCPSRFVAEHRLEAHLRAHEGLKPFLCKLCDKTFNTFRNYRIHHKQKHTENSLRLTCEFPGCDLVFTTKKGAKGHFRRTHDPNYQVPDRIPFICDLCGNSYTTNGGLKRHKYSHAPETLPFSCTMCPKKFYRKSKLDSHMKRHQGILDFECPHCDLKTASQGELNQHIKNVHEKQDSEPIPCDLCLMVFSSKTCLKRHVDVVHRNIKKFSCSVCGFMFSQKDHLNRHMKSHQRQGDIASFSLAAQLTMNTDE